MSQQPRENFRLMIVAGETSGDAHAASLVAALRELAPETSFEFFGGTQGEMRAAGVESVVRTDELSITGLVEIASALPRFLRAYRELKRAGVERKPDAVVLVDFPDFNLRLARFFHARGLKIIYYVSPQLWAWRGYRVRNIRRDVDLLLALLPFEPAWYAARGVRHVEFVGHTLATEVRPTDNRAEFCQRHGLDATRTIIALLPGSRRKELERILPPMLEAAKIISRAHAGAQFVVALAPARTDTEAERIISSVVNSNDAALASVLRLVRGETRDALSASDAAAVASGTATLEAALTQTPLVVVYKESKINWHVLGSLITTEHYGLVNLVAGERVAAELMQYDFTPAALARELIHLLDPAHNARTRARLRAATARLGNKSASRRAAEAILRSLREWRAGVRRERGAEED
ncbi:MAG: lipid-A-disaccharide synthase [Acidobacteriota bacterium]|jgi:lipid-A-disaccharide synthase|nr:lipid-A-disaccharide synthase [Acidobacteriota bacterium]